MNTMGDAASSGALPAEISELAVASAELARLSAEAEALATEESAATEAALVPLNRQSPTEIKAGLAIVRRRVVAKRAEVEAAAARVRELAERQAAIARNAIAPLAKQIKRFEDGIEAVNLYLGDAESIVTLMDGEPAPASEPVRIRQMVLSMDEECAVAADDGGIDHMNIELFDQWLLADPAHVDQVLPERKGIVALVPRMAGREYGDPWANLERNKRNQETYLLIRNGEKLYRYVPGFTVGRRLVPAADEFTRFFESEQWTSEGKHTVRTHLRPGSRQWAEAEEKADVRQRHYMKVALLIQGIVDRSILLHPLPPEGLDLLGGDVYEDGRAVIITDAENALSSGAETFRQWQHRINRQMTVGMRIIGAFQSQGFRNEKGTGRSHVRISPNCTDRPRTGVVYELEGRRIFQGVEGFFFRFERTHETWTRNRYGYDELKVPERRASCVVLPDDTFVLCLDLAEVADMGRFLASRAARSEYVTMFPVLKAAIAAKKAEEAEEAPFRDMLAGELAKRNGVDLEDAVAAVPALVCWYKFARRHHRTLVGEDPKIIDAICTEHRRRLTERVDTGGEQEVVSELRSRYPDLLYVGRKKSGEYVAFLPQETEGWWSVFVVEITRTPSGKETVAEWRLPGARPSRWRSLYESEKWAAFDRSASASIYASRPEVEAGAEELRKQWNPEWGPLVAITFGRDPYCTGVERVFTCWAYAQGSEYDAEHSLTGKVSMAYERHSYVRWHRGRGGAFVLGKLDRPWSSYNSLNSGRCEEFDPIWRNHVRPGDSEVLFEDQGVVAEIVSDFEKYLAFKKISDELHRIVREYWRSVQDQWVEREEKAAYDKFI